MPVHWSHCRVRRPLHVCQAMPVGRHHRQRFVGQQQQSAVQRKAALFHRDRKHRPRDHRRKLLHRNLSNRLRHSRQLGKTFPAHARNPCSRPAAGEIRPVVLGKLHRDIGIRQQSHVIQQLSRRNRARTLFLHPGRARGSQTQFQIRRSEVKPVSTGLQQHVRKDRDRGLFLDHTLRQTQFADQIRLTDSELHFVGSDPSLMTV